MKQLSYTWPSITWTSRTEFFATSLWLRRIYGKSWSPKQQLQLLLLPGVHYLFSFPGCGDRSVLIIFLLIFFVLVVFLNASESNNLISPVLHVCLLVVRNDESALTLDLSACRKQWHNHSHSQLQLHTSSG